MGIGYEIWHVEGTKEALVWNRDKINPIYTTLIILEEKNCSSYFKECY